MANTIAMFDPTRTLSFAVQVAELGWSLLCVLDDIDQDDPLGTEVWAIDESTIPNKASSISSHIFHFKEQDGDNDWELEMEAGFYDPVTI